ncbi:MAG: acyltransferase [Candidatus Eremiobacteraeota bacterium]|nr:acyltransferase [Candidatus Eremiobacteraeota bacterium]
MKLQNVQALRAVAALLVVAVHLYGIEAKYLLGWPWLSPLHIYGQFGVDLFFVISGAVMTITAWKSFGAASSAWRFIGRRVTRIVPPYWLVSGLILPFYLYRPALFNPHSAHAPNVWASFLLLPQAGEPLLIVGWTLVYEMFFYLVFTLTLLFQRRLMPLIIGLWAVSFIMVRVWVPVSTPFLRVISSPMNGEFVFGIMIGALFMRRRLYAPHAFFAVALFLLCGTLWVTAQLRDDYISVNWSRLAYVGIPMALLVYGALGLEQCFAQVAPKLLQRIGDSSYSLYLWHVPILTVLGFALHYTHFQGFGAHLGLVVVGYAVVVSASIILYRRIERPLLTACQKPIKSPTGKRIASTNAW